MATIILGPRCNRRVTCSSNPSNDRSESCLVIDPKDPYHIVCASKKFTDPHTYAFSLACCYSYDGGQSWTEAPALSLLPSNLITTGPGKNDDWVGVSDPALAFDNIGNVYLLALPFGNHSDYDLRGIAVYKSSDGGKTWSAPNHIHNVLGDDKQWIVGDTNPTSPFYGRVYGCWDSSGIGTSNLGFARTTDNGTSWKSIKVSGVDQPAGTGIPGINDSGAPEINVMRDGTVFIVWVSGGQIKFTKSTDGGDSFTAPTTVASGITGIPGHLPGGKFRTLTLPTACAGTGNHIVVAWSDYRDGTAHIYFRRSTNAGNSWVGSASGTRLLTGAVASAANQHEFHPQLIATPAGEVGCAFYLFGPHGSGEFPASLIDVILAVSVNDGTSFNDRATVTDQAWDPTVDEVWAHGAPTITFIGEYFGLDASRLGFFPLWTDTRTMVQELFCSRLSVRPADVLVRDSSTDVGNVPSPGDHWEYVDLIVRRQPDGDTTFVNQDLLRDGVTDHYVYARVTNNGPNKAQNVMLSIRVGNYPSLQSLPGLEFRYPQDWYPGDWDTPALQSTHLALNLSAPTNVNNGQTKIIEPVLWPAAQIPDPSVWHHPCLLAEVLVDNDDSAGGPDSIPVPAEGDKNACNYGSYFWGSNNITQRNLSYAPLPLQALSQVSFSFIAGNYWSTSQFMEIIVDKGRDLAEVPMTLRREPITLHKSPPPPPDQKCPCPELVITEPSKILVRAGKCDLVEILAAPGTVWKCGCEKKKEKTTDASDDGTVLFGIEKQDQVWKLVQPQSSIGFPITAGALYKMTLSFVVPFSTKVTKDTAVRIFQRNNKRILTGGVILKFKRKQAPGGEEEEGEHGKGRGARRRARGAKRR